MKKKWKGAQQLENVVFLSGEDWVDLMVEFKNASGTMWHPFDNMFPNYEVNMFLTQLDQYLHSLMESDLIMHVHFHHEMKNVLTIMLQIGMGNNYFWEGLARLRIENPGYVISFCIGQYLSHISLTDIGSKINYTLKLYFFKNYNKKFHFNENEVKISRIKYKDRYTYIFNCSKILDHIFNKHNEYQHFILLPQLRYNLTEGDHLHPESVVFPDEFEGKKTEKGTWNEASDFCKSLRGYLPIISSREQEKLTSLLKLLLLMISQSFGYDFGIHHQIISIGLRYHKVSIQ